MTETTETQSAAPAEDTRAHNENLIFAALAEAGIHTLTVDFDGSGDSGQIEEIAAFDADRNDIPLPSNRKLQLAPPEPGNPPVEMTLQEAIETLAYDYLEDTLRTNAVMRSKRRNIARATELIAAPVAVTNPTPERDDTSLDTSAAADHRPPCPCCGGRMIIVESFGRGGAPRGPPPPEAAVRATML